jgi:hypothetical protein
MNGFPLCVDCHKLAHTKLGEKILIEKMESERYEYLLRNEKVLIKDYLLFHKMSRKEFDNMVVNDLKQHYENYKKYWIAYESC